MIKLLSKANLIGGKLSFNRFLPVTLILKILFNRKINYFKILIK
jgi:hypothetical protein